MLLCVQMLCHALNTQKRKQFLVFLKYTEQWEKNKWNNKQTWFQSRRTLKGTGWCSEDQLLRDTSTDGAGCGRPHCGSDIWAEMQMLWRTRVWGQLGRVGGDSGGRHFELETLEGRIYWKTCLWPEWLEPLRTLTWRIRTKKGWQTR